jgi:hypothetical protein
VTSEKFLELGIFNADDVDAAEDVDKDVDAIALGETAGDTVIRTIISNSYTRRIIAWSKATCEKLKAEHNLNVASAKVRGLIRASRQFAKVRPLLTFFSSF